MTATLTFKDETLTGNLIQTLEIPVKTETLTLREIIMLRVEEEIRRQTDEKHKRFFTGLGDLTHAERVLNKPKMPQNRRDAPDTEAFGYRALDAFQKNAFFVLVNDRQVDDLEARFQIDRATHVSFVRLTPLVGG